MRLTTLAVALAASVSAKPTLEAADNGGILKGAYIVEFESGHASVDSFYQNLTTNGIAATPRQQYTQPGIFSGASFKLDSDSRTYLDIIGNFTQVKKVSPVRLFSRVAPVQGEAKLWRSVDLEKLRARSLARRAGPAITIANDNFTTHVMTGVDKLHKEGLDGSGIVIAEIDTGIDYTLPALGGGFGPGYKVAFGTDLVGDAYTGSNEPVPDDDPMDCAGHGTHVAGIIGASNDPYVIGVAPNATLGIYKVFGCEGNVGNDILITAFMMAHNHGVDLISSSIGGASGWPEEPWAAATAAIVKAGTPCILSAGNSGSAGLWNGQSASAGDDVTSVGSVDNTHVPLVVYYADDIIAGTTTKFEYTPARGSWSDVELPLWADTYDTSVKNDFCNGVSENLAGKIALVRRGTCTFAAKAQAVVNAGGKYMIVYNNAPGTILMALDFSPITAAAMVTPEVGARWIAALAAGEEVIVSFPGFSPDEGPEVITPGAVNTVTGGYMSTYSTWNPSNENTIKPVISAPGGSVLSTYPAALGGYQVLSGTSMSAPFIAGVVALYKQSKGKNISPTAINAALASAGKALKFNDGTTTFPYLASVAQQGAGLIDAYALIHAGITVSEANLAYNDTAHHVKNAAFYVANTGKTAQTYTLTHTPAANFYSFSADFTDSVAVFPGLPTDTKYSTAVISPSTLTIKPGEKKRVTVSVTPDASLDASLVPFYSGFIDVTGGGETIHLPYGGAATVMHDITILETNQGWPFWDDELAISTSAAGVPTYKPSDGSFPIVFYNNKWASASIRLDIISVDGPNKVYAAGIPIVGSVPGFPLAWEPRRAFNDYRGIGWDGSVDDGTLVPTGTYKLSLRLAKVFADLSKGREYERYDSDAFFLDMS